MSIRGCGVVFGLRPDRTDVLFELVVALEREDRNAEAVEVLERSGAPAGIWPAGYLLSANALLAGDVERAVRDLRGWHFALNGGVLATLSPYGYDAGMNGRFAWLQVSPSALRHGLERVRLVLDAAGLRPTAIGLLPDRSAPSSGSLRPACSTCPPPRTDRGWRGRPYSRST